MTWFSWVLGRCGFHGPHQYVDLCIFCTVQLWVWRDRHYKCKRKSLELCSIQHGHLFRYSIYDPFFLLNFWDLWSLTMFSHWWGNLTASETNWGSQSHTAGAEQSSSSLGLQLSTIFSGSPPYFLSLLSPPRLFSSFLPSSILSSLLLLSLKCMFVPDEEGRERCMHFYLFSHRQKRCSVVDMWPVATCAQFIRVVGNGRLLQIWSCHWLSSSHLVAILHCGVI